MTPDLVQVPVGSDAFEARLITEACRAAGITVELLTGDNSGVDPVMGRIQGHRLLVAARDLPRVRTILGRRGNS